MKKLLLLYQILKNLFSRSIDLNKNNHILVVSNGHFGDFVHAIPTILALSQFHNVHVFTKESNKVYDFNKEFLYVTKEFAKHHNFDLILVLTDDDKEKWRGNTIYLDAIRFMRKVYWCWNEMHWADFFFEIAKYNDNRLIKQVSPQIANYKDNTEWIVIHPGASAKNKAWELSKYLKLYDKIKNNTPYKPILLITAYDEFVKKEFIKRKDNERYEVYYMNDTKRLSDVAKRTLMFIGNDSGVMHYFSLFNCIVFGIFTYGCAITHYPWTTKGYYYFEKDVFEDYYKNNKINKIHLKVNPLFNEIQKILFAGTLTNKNENFFESIKT